MPARSPRASDLIAAEIAASGPITFARFMEIALYDPSAGYYSADHASIGRSGDFFTNVSVGPVFGRLLAAQFEEMWAALGQPSTFSIVEQGSNDGRLAADILAALSPPASQAIQYWIIEPSPSLRGKQLATLAPWARHVHWAPSIDLLPPFQGVHFSNELIDALPFHILQSIGSGWHELFVTSQDGTFAFHPAPPGPEASTQLSLLPSRPHGTLAELRPAASRWLRSVATRLTAGFLLVIDYGYPREQLYLPHRTRGTFSCYRHHQRDDKPLDLPGEKDITAHIDFTLLAETAAEAGLSLTGFTDQHHFIVGAAESLLRSLEGSLSLPSARKTLRAIQTLMHPESMGTQFRYLALSKNLPASPPSLSGFRHARNPATELFAISPHLL